MCFQIQFLAQLFHESFRRRRSKNHSACAETEEVDAADDHADRDGGIVEAICTSWFRMCTVPSSILPKVLTLMRALRHSDVYQIRFSLGLV